jgi:hypothetical protein
LGFFLNLSLNLSSAFSETATDARDGFVHDARRMTSPENEVSFAAPRRERRLGR